MENSVEEPADRPPGAADRSISMERANVLAVVMIPVLAVCLFGPFILLHGIKAFAAGWLPLASVWIWLPALVVTVVVHEALHGLGFRMAGAPSTAIEFGFQLKTMTPFAACRVPIAVRGYRLAAALPGLLMGVLPAVFALVTGTGWIVVAAFWMLTFASGDMLIVWLVRDLDRDTLVIDHPERAGCRIVGTEAESERLIAEGNG